MIKYDTYKDSRVEWIGAIPSHWQIMPFKRRMKMNNGADYKDWVTDEGYPVIGSGGQFAFASKFMYDGEVVLLGRKGTIDRPLYFNGPFWAVDTMFYAVPDKRVYCKYMYYQALTFPFNYYATATALPSMTQTELGNNPICVPPYDEQRAIADYLDTECKKIDDLIAKEEKRVILLQEVRLSILTKAVLQGLNDRVETAPNKHNWLGNIPKHWKIMPLRYTATAKGCCFIDGDWIESKDIDYDGSIKYLTTGNVGSGFYKEQGLGYITEEKFKELDCTDVLPGDLLISRLNEPIARTCIVPDLGSRIVTAVDNVIFRPNPNILDRKFACYYLNNGRLTEHANIIARGATMHRVSRTMLGHLPVVLPPLDEQRDIVAFLDKECNQYDNSIVKANHQIDLLKEYKQSLITEIVTGKRKVC